MWYSPTACIGEFDSLEGPRLKYAHEYFDYRRNNDVRDVTQMVAFVGGDMLVGKAIASGRVHANYEAYMRSIASRALVSNDSREESVIFQESGGPVVGSICFSVNDILARGEKRRFCLVFMSPSVAQIVARWGLISAFSRMLIDDVTSRASARQDREYEIFADLERRREDARRNPLRSLMELMAGENETEQDMALQLHCYFEVCLPIIFSSPITCAFPTTGADDVAALTSAFRRSMEEYSPFVRLYVESIDVDEDVPVGAALVPEYAKNLLFPEEEIIVKPLTVWLIDFFTRSTESAVYHLLNTLFSGNQVLISSTDPMDGVNFALSLAYVLPPALAKWSVLADEYVMPYKAQIISFSAQFMSTHEFVSQHTIGAARSPRLPPPASEKSTLTLEKLGDSVVHVALQGGRIYTISWSASPEVQRSTIATRCTALLEKTLLQSPSHNVLTATMKLLTIQVEQLVAEYVVRGGVYTSLFREQEVRTNKETLGPSGSEGSVLRSSYMRRLLSLFQNADLNARRKRSSSRPGSGSLDKHSGLCQESCTSFTRDRFVFSSFSESDHATLIFLGQASAISAPQ